MGSVTGVLFEFVDVLVEGSDGSSIIEVEHASIPDEGITVIVGPSGAGKSTLLRLCNRLIVPIRGEVRFQGENLTSFDPLALRRRVGMVFQQPALFGGSGFDNLKVADPQISGSDVQRLFARVGLSDGFVHGPVDDLSGGEAQRLCLARTLATRPEVLLMDEPTASLDPVATRRLEGLVRRLGVPIVWVTHDVVQVRRIADHVMVMTGGRLVSDHESVERFLEGGTDGRW